MDSQSEEQARTYYEAVRAAEAAGVDVEPEAQLTGPVANLLENISKSAGLPSLRLLRESQLNGVRPDFVALAAGRPVGWLELKSPDKSIDAAQWVGHDRRQWRRLSELDSLLVCNGRQVQHFKLGESSGESVELPYDNADSFSPDPLIGLLRRFVESRPKTVSRVSDLAHRLAPLARLLRERLESGFDQEPVPQALSQAREVWANNVHEGVDGRSFSYDLAQVIAYSLAIAALRGGADTDSDGIITLGEAHRALQSPARVLSATLGPVLGSTPLLDYISAEVGAIERLVSVVDSEKISQTYDARGEPWLWFYEDFLEAYDPKARQDAGVYYTPSAVVACQVRLVADVLENRFDRRLGFGAPDVVVLDPACGSGTYPLSVIDSAAITATKRRGKAGPAQVVANLRKNLFAFELLPGPYAVAHLRVGQRLADLNAAETANKDINVLLSDTLESPDEVEVAPGLFGDAAELAAERARAAKVKRDQQVMVIMGNPPYDRVAREASGGWVVHGAREPESLFDELLKRASAAGVKFSHQASLYNLYVYFWRWAIWKAFEHHGEGPAVVSFITGSSWLRGEGFIGLRQLARQFGDEIWVIDLGGDNKGAVPEENVFAIETPVAIVTIIRFDNTQPESSRVLYRRIRGTRSEKLAALELVNASQPVDSWTEVTPGALGAPLAPVGTDASWLAFPAIRDLMPWQSPGCKYNRMWPISPDPSVLHSRWAELVGIKEAAEKESAFATGTSGRTIYTSVAGLTRLAELSANTKTPPIRRYGYHSFDRQWSIADPRVANLERPSLWSTSGEEQMYLSSLTTELGAGPALVASDSVPDMNFFKGSGGGFTIPLWRNSTATQPNLAPGVLDTLMAEHSGRIDTVEAEDFFAYIYCVLSTPGFREKFAKELEDRELRVPITSDSNLFDEMVATGREMLWLHSFATRFRDAQAGRQAELPDVDGLGWEEAITQIPSDPSDIRFDANTHELKIADGLISGVKPAVWDYEVSGMSVMSKWLGYRTRRGIGKAMSSKSKLDRIRPDAWLDAWNDELLDLVRVLDRSVALHSQQDAFLDRVCEGNLIDTDRFDILPEKHPLRLPPEVEDEQIALDGV